MGKPLEAVEDAGSRAGRRLKLPEERVVHAITVKCLCARIADDGSAVVFRNFIDIHIKLAACFILPLRFHKSSFGVAPNFAGFGGSVSVGSHCTRLWDTGIRTSMIRLLST